MNKTLLSGGVLLLGFVLLLVSGCATTKHAPPPSPIVPASSEKYIIGPGDTLQVFVWRYPEVSTTVPVRPDGRITMPLVEDMQAVGKTSTQLARDLEQALDKYLKGPVVTVTITQFVGTFKEQIRVVGQAVKPQALTYRDELSLLDVMIEVGGLTEFAAGNKAKLVRRTGNSQQTYDLRLADLLDKGDMSANIAMQPGDSVVIPESWF
jgi:polysaccharide export outer membrane protein